MKGAFARRHPAVNVLFFVSAALPSALNSHPLILLISAFAAFAYSLRLRGKGALQEPHTAHFTRGAHEPCQRSF